MYGNARLLDKFKSLVLVYFISEMSHTLPFLSISLYLGIHWICRHFPTSSRTGSTTRPTLSSLPQSPRTKTRVRSKSPTNLRNAENLLKPLPSIRQLMSIQKKRRPRKAIATWNWDNLTLINMNRGMTVNWTIFRAFLNYYNSLIRWFELTILYISLTVNCMPHLNKFHL